MKYVAIAILATALGILFGHLSTPDTWRAWSIACAASCALLCGALAYPRRRLGVLRDEAKLARVALGEAVAEYQRKHERAPRALRPRQRWADRGLSGAGEAIGEVAGRASPLGGAAGALIGAALEATAHAAGRAAGAAFYRLTASAERQADDRAIAQLVHQRDATAARLRAAVAIWAITVAGGVLVAVLAFLFQTDRLLAG